MIVLVLYLQYCNSNRIHNPLETDPKHIATWTKVRLATRRKINKREPRDKLSFLDIPQTGVNINRAKNRNNPPKSKNQAACPWPQLSYHSPSSWADLYPYLTAAAAANIPPPTSRTSSTSSLLPPPPSS